MSEEMLLEIKLALQGLQMTQQQILEKVNDIRVDHKELVSRVDAVESNLTIVRGALIPLTILLYLGIDWAKTKLGFTV